MDPRAAHLIEALGLRPHPEGGHYRRFHESALEVQPADGRPPRPALTSIYYLLAEGEVSCWHRVASDEVWCYLEGGTLELITADPDFENVTRCRLGASGDDAHPIHVVPAGSWQAARSTGAYTLVACAVAPGFDFADFEMLRDARGPVGVEEVRRRYPEFAGLI